VNVLIGQFPANNEPRKRAPARESIMPGFMHCLSRTVRHLASCFVVMVTAVVIAPYGRAADYPDKPVHLIVPFPAGSSVDMVARPMAQGLSILFGQPVVIDNRPGGGSIIGSAAVARAAPDGYTMLLVTGALTAQATLSKLSFDPIRDFEPISQIASSCGLLLLTNKKINAVNVQQLVDLARSRPGGLTYGTLGYGSSTHVAGALFGKLAGINIVGVPYTTSTLLSDLMSGRVDIAFVSTVSAVAPLAAGNVRALAVTGPRRCPAYPDTPTLKELGYQQFDREGYFGLSFPATTPAPLVDRVYRNVKRVLDTPDMKTALARSGLSGVGSEPREFQKLLKDDLEKQAEIFRLTGLGRH
jgi:tripartite-type tricarboxylate transporter receptor subunit TctC